jgi:hypothetical protein
LEPIPLELAFSKKKERTETFISLRLHEETFAVIERKTYQVVDQICIDRDATNKPFIVG